jgi:hypothetical protein
MLAFLCWNRHGNTAEKLCEHYGKQPSEIAARHFADKTSRANLRQLIREQWWKLAGAANQYADETEMKALDENQCPEQLQKLLDADGVVLKPFEHRRRSYAQLTDQQFYEQAVRLTYIIAAYGAEYVARKEVEAAIRIFEQEVRSQLSGKANLSAWATMAKISEAVQYEQQNQGYLQCEIPSTCLSFMEI